ncbi:CDP-glycerol glycerophosphotransferase family protein, partial [Glutamicibacter arilaitensis]
MGDSRIIFIKKESDAYLRYLATAGWLINNNTFPPYFSRKEEQKYLNTWHGIPLKTLGRDIRSGMMDHKNAARNLLHATHLIAPNEHFMNVLTERNEVQGLLTAKVAITGYPRVDQLVNESAVRRDEVRRMIGADVDETVVLYAPTWRGDLSNKVIDVDKLLSDVTALNSTGCKVIFKGHAMVEAELAASPLNDLLLDVDIDTNTLLLGVDVLISDYSSIIFDFMPLQRPIVYYTYDLEEYKQERGLYFEIEDLPGVRCDNIGDLVNSISRIKDDASFDLVLETPLSRSLLAHEDGKAASKAASFFFEDDMTAVVEEHADKKPVLFFQGSFIPNGISTAFDAL